MGFIKTKVETKTGTETPGVLSIVVPESSVICKSPGKLKLLLEKIAPGTSTHYVSKGDWSMHDLVMQLLKKYQPAELFISTYALRETPVRQLVMAIDRKEISSIKMLLDYRAKVRTPQVYELAQMNINQIYLTSVHAKVCVLRSAAGSITIAGSANWTTNPKIEYGVVTMNEQIAEFNIDWMQNIMNDAEIFK